MKMKNSHLTFNEQTLQVFFGNVIRLCDFHCISSMKHDFFKLFLQNVSNCKQLGKRKTTESNLHSMFPSIIHPITNARPPTHEFFKSHVCFFFKP